MKCLLKFVYTSNLDLSSETVDQLAECAHQLGIQSAFELCVCFMINNIDLYNVFSFYNVAFNTDCKVLKECAFKVIADNFLIVCQTPHFCLLPIDRLLPILKSDDLQVRSEKDVLDAAISWIKYDMSSRLEIADRLLSCIQL
ncbi:hypothetical protein HELRODRAFT_74871, partial [Helobdella robusta]|uniref:BACK domain-containing protein n=1 Tax=Helobdella robusta TaxID=6412 RepID=T1G1W8_HELRO